MTWLERGKGRLSLEPLEDRTMPAVSAVLAGGVLTVQGTPGNDQLVIRRQAGQIVLLDHGREVAHFSASSVAQIQVNAGAGNDRVQVGPEVAQPVLLRGGPGDDLLQ